MRRPDWFARLLARVLPWFDQAREDAERKATRVALAESRAVRDTIRDAYRATGARLTPR